MSTETTVLITGASSGLGLAFLHHYASQPSTKAHGIDITPLPPSTLTSHPNITFHQLDITSLSSLPDLASALQQVQINLLIHSAGIRGLVPSVVERKKGDPDGVAAAETYEVMDKETMMRTLEINTWATFNTIRTFLPNLLLSASVSTTSPPKAIILSSRMGSISANVAGGGYAYRASKAGLNAIVRSFSIDVPEVEFLLLHPGRVETGLVAWKEEGAIDVQESLRDCLGVIGKAGVEGGLESGSYVDRFGAGIEW